MDNQNKPVLLPGLMIVGALVAGITVGSTVVVLMAFGLGSLLALFLPLSRFEASLLSVVAIVGVLAAAWRTIEHIARSNMYRPGWVDEHEYGDDHDFDDIEDEIEWSEHPVVHVAASGRVGRNAPCPCGSGRKYKRCCGSTRATGKQSPA